MKKLMVILVVFAVALFSCERIDTEVIEEAVETEKPHESYSRLVVRSGYGFSSIYGIYVQQGVATLLKLNIEGQTEKLKTVIWKIDGSNYEGLQVSHKFNSIGESKINIKVTFDDGSEAEQDFVVTSVLDISSADPVQVFSTKADEDYYDVLFLFSKERLRYAKGTTYYYDGLIVDWKKKVVPENNSYVINSEGKPELVDGVGKYVGVKLKLKNRGLYNITLVHSGDNWIDISGSKYVRSDNPGLAWFWFENGEILSQGNTNVNDAPGLNGDNCFRFSVSDNEKASLFFKLDNEYTSSAFVLKQDEGGSYSDTILMEKATNHEKWGKIEIDLEGQLEKVLSFRYGENIEKPNDLSPNMKESYYYDEFYKSLRLILFVID